MPAASLNSRGIVVQQPRSELPFGIVASGDLPWPPLIKEGETFLTSPNQGRGGGEGGYNQLLSNRNGDQKIGCWKSGFSINVS